MIRSMTGFGRGEAAAGPYRVRVELRSVNHRFFEFSARLPSALWAWEEPLRRRVAERVQRGRVDAAVHLEVEGGARRLRVDKPLVLAYHSALEEIRRDLRLPGEITLDLLARRPELFVFEDHAAPDDAAVSALEAAADEALAQLVAAREAEGQALVADMLAALDRIESHVAAIAERAPALPVEHRERLERRLAEVHGLPELDPNRLAAELALLAERLDVSEELVRLRSHVARLRETLTGGGPVGRRCEFLLQEANREVNTLGSKAQDAAVSARIVELKVELEKLREQAQNLE